MCYFAAAASRISHATSRSRALPAPVVMAPMKAMKAMKARRGTRGFGWLLLRKMQVKVKDSAGIDRTCESEKQLNLMPLGWCLLGKVTPKPTAACWRGHEGNESHEGRMCRRLFPCADLATC